MRRPPLQHRAAALALGLCAAAAAHAECSLFRATNEAGEARSGAALAAYDDSFDGTLDAWSVYQPGRVDFSTSGGQLLAHVPTPNASLWFNAAAGSLLYRSVEGDFKATTSVHARRSSDPQQAPNQTVDLAGLMARNPDAGSGQNYVFVVVGYDVDDLSVEIKYTTNSTSNYIGPSWPNGDAELRICRVGNDYRLYARATPGSGAWQLRNGANPFPFTRNDLPCTLQVGLIAYSNQPAPDMTGYFDDVRFAPVADVAACTVD